MPDHEKTTFIIEKGFVLLQSHAIHIKNARATYQRLVNKMFTDKIGRTMEVYVGNMMVKSPMVEQHIRDLADT